MTEKLNIDKEDWNVRTRLLMGQAALDRLASSHVLVTGLGGVGGSAAEALARAGIGRITIADGDIVQTSNRNRQLIALRSNEGRFKTELFEERLKDINPDVEIHKITEFLRDERMEEVLETRFDYVLDAIDTLSPKVFLIYKTLMKKYPLVSSMGSGGKFNPDLVQVTDISATYNCRLAFTIRKRLHKLGIRKGFKAVFSPEKVEKEAVELVKDQPNKISNVGTISYMPPLFGMVMASVVIRDLSRIQKD